MSALRWAAAGAVFAGVAIMWARPAAARDGSRPARNYVEAAGQSDTFEMLEAETALTGSSDPQVRAYAEMMLRDHRTTGRALADAAASAGMSPPAGQVSGDQALLLGALQGLSGAEFDKAYVQHQALAHRAALTVQQDYAASGDQPALRRAAASAAPLVAAHLAAADRLKARLGS